MIIVIETAIPGVVIIEPKVFGDARGYFFESFSERDFKQTVLEPLERIELPGDIKPYANIGNLHFVQDNESMSSYGVMRGLHYQRMPYTQSKLVRCVKGAVLDVAVDHPQRLPDIRPACGCGTDGRQSSSILYSKRIRPRIRCIERDCRLPVQVRQLLCPSQRWWHQHQG